MVANGYSEPYRRENQPSELPDGLVPRYGKVSDQQYFKDVMRKAQGVIGEWADERGLTPSLTLKVWAALYEAEVSSYGDSLRRRAAEQRGEIPASVSIPGYIIQEIEEIRSALIARKSASKEILAELKLLQDESTSQDPNYICGRLCRIIDKAEDTDDKLSKNEKIEKTMREWQGGSTGFGRFTYAEWRRTVALKSYIIPKAEAILERMQETKE